MAWVVRYKKPNGKWARVRNRKRPNGVFPTKAEATKAELAFEKKTGKKAHVGGKSVPVPKPHIAVRNLSPSHGRNGRKVVVLHSTESHDRAGLTDVAGILSYLQSVGLGVHYCIDGDGHVGQGAYHASIVYHAKGANTNGVGIEQIGFARWSTAQWLKYPTGKARKQLREVAHLIAYICDKEGIPIKRSKTHGVALHKDFPEGGHTDPGSGYPIGWVLREARKIRRQWRGRV